MSDNAKRAAGRAAAGYVEDGMRLGLGTGSTVTHFLDAVADRGLSDIRGVPTSEATAARCRGLGIDLLDAGDVPRLDLCVDGADELTQDLVLTKGGGGALLREKVVASMSARMLVIGTPDKLVERLADTFGLPVEVVPFAQGPVRRRLQDLGFRVEPRDEGAYRTDNDNLVLDCWMAGGIEDPEVMDATLSMIPGVVDHGLFVDLASAALLGDEEGRITILGDLDGDPATTR